MAENTNKNRASLHPRFEKLKPVFEKVFSYLLESCDENWYPSLLVERRSSKTLVIDTTKDSFTENFSEGIVIRIYNGFTVLEAACDNLEKDFLISEVDHLVKLAKNHLGQRAPKYYRAKAWAERKTPGMEEELTSQIPRDVSSSSWVHFGVPQEIPLWSEDSELMRFAKNNFKRLTDYAKILPENAIEKNPDYTLFRMDLMADHFLFIDSEVRMSQTLYRNRSIPMLMKSGDRAVFLQGGLGGQETLRISDEVIAKVYKNQKVGLSAERIKPGRYKLLMSPSVTGVFAHEAFGHSQEGDTWLRGRSKAKELYESGEVVGNEHATILNNPAIYKNGSDSFGAWGSYYFDEEGWLAEKQYLVTRGKLERPMTSLSAAIHLDVPRTANGKRENWSHGVYTRQTNTYFEEGLLSFEEIIAKVDYGFLASYPFGGMEDPKAMGIQVGIAFLEEIRDGRLTGRSFKAPNGGAIQMTGYVPDYLKSIIAKTKIDAFSSEKDDSLKHPWNEVGGCGKYHKELVQAGCGGTYLLIDNALLA